MEYTAEQLIEILKLEPHVAEGGWYRFLWSGGVNIPKELLPQGYGGDRWSSSLIYYMLRKGEISRWHQLKSPEIWTWHCGGSLEMTLGGEGEAPQPCGAQRIGPRLELGERFHLVAPANQWQTTRLIDGDYALVSCVVSPAFDAKECYMPDLPLYMPKV